MRWCNISKNDCGSSLIVFSQEDVDEYLSIDTRNSRDFPTHPVCKPDDMTSVRRMIYTLMSRHYIRLRLKSLRCHRGCLLRKSSFFTTIAMRMDIDVCRLGQSYPQANSGGLIWCSLKSQWNMTVVLNRPSAKQLTMVDAVQLMRWGGVGVVDGDEFAFPPPPWNPRCHAWGGLASSKFRELKPKQKQPCQGRLPNVWRAWQHSEIFAFRWILCLFALWDALRPIPFSATCRRLQLRDKMWSLGDMRLSGCDFFTGKCVGWQKTCVFRASTGKDRLIKNSECRYGGWLERSPQATRSKFVPPSRRRIFEWRSRNCQLGCWVFFKPFQRVEGHFCCEAAGRSIGHRAGRFARRQRTRCGPHCLDGCDLLQNGCHKVCLIGLLIKDFSKNPVMFLDKTHSRQFKVFLQCSFASRSRSTNHQILKFRSDLGVKQIRYNQIANF